MDAAKDGEIALGRESDDSSASGLYIARVECKRFTLDVGLMDEVVVVDHGDVLADVECDVAGAEALALLGDDVIGC